MRHHDSTRGQNSRELKSTIRIVDVAQVQLEARWIERDVAFGDDTGQDRVAAAARMLDDARLCGVDDQVMHDARQAEVAGELLRHIDPLCGGREDLDYDDRVGNLKGCASYLFSA